MKNSNKKKKIIKIVIIVAVFCCLAIILKMVFTKKDNSTSLFLKDYKVNEYIPVYISDEDMAKLYLNDYIHNMYSDIEYAYNLLDEEYRNAKFGSLDGYRTYVNSFASQYSNFEVSKYYKKSIGNYVVFGVYDKNENIYIFKIQGVMQYKVLLDDYTIEI